MTRPHDKQKLDSWKAIARHLDRSVRTARRWEAEEGLPVHRHMHRRQGRVFAYIAELDAWLEQRAVAPRASPPSPGRRPGETDQSIAVLPFAYLGPDRRLDYLADGFADEVIAGLSKLRALRVISRTSTMALKGTTLDAPAIARSLSVRYLLEGTVQHRGDRLKVSVRLIDPNRDDRVWSAGYPGTLAAVFEIQERIARETAAALEMEITSDERRRLGERPIGDVVAWQCALQARHEAMRWTADAIGHAIRLLENGLGAVGENAHLYAALGRAHLQYREAGIDLGEGPLEVAEGLSRKVFALDPDSAVGHHLRGWIRYARGDIAGAIGDLDRALALDANDADSLALLANCLLIAGRVAEARPRIDRLLAIDPLMPLNRCMPGWADVLDGRPERALGPYREMFEMDDTNPMGRLFYLWILVLNARVDSARKLADGFPDPEALPARVGGLLVEAVSGTAAALPDLPEELNDRATSTDVFPRLLAHAYALSGDGSRATQWLEAAVARGFVNYPFLARHDRTFSRLRGNRSFDRLLTEVRRRWSSLQPRRD